MFLIEMEMKYLIEQFCESKFKLKLVYFVDIFACYSRDGLGIPSPEPCILCKVRRVYLCLKKNFLRFLAN